MGLRPSIVFLAFMTFITVPVWPANSADKEPLPVYVIERDTLQTRNFTPIINHQTMVVNLGERPLSLSLSSRFPKHMDKKGDGYPAFLDDSLISDPLFTPLEITPKKVSYLVQPEITVGAADVSYLWNKVVLPPGESVVAQYDNYYGEQDYYWKDYGFDFHGLRVKTDYSAQPQKNGQVELTLSFEITNTTNDAVQDLGLGVFVPVQQLLKDRSVTFLKLEKICTSANIEASKLTKADGFGEAAEGVAASISIKELQPGKQEKFFLCISGSHPVEAVTSWPIVTVTGRSIRTAIWPATTVSTETPINEARFSYLSYNLVIKDHQRFRLSGDGAVIEKVKLTHP